MNDYPISISTKNEPISKFFMKIVKFHLPPEDSPRVLDPTCGKKHLWKGFLQTELDDNLNSCKVLDKYDVIFSDIKDYGQEIVSSVGDIDKKINGKFDGIIYDPPYLFGVESIDDERKEDYGGYSQTYEDLLWFMDIANEKFPEILKENGKLIVKCSDQFHPDERKFYSHHITWIERLENFKLIDLFVYKYTRISPTAYQVKNRPCSIIAHTYFLVFEVRK